MLKRKIEVCECFTRARLTSGISHSPQKYYVSGELIRNSIAEGQPGLPLYVDLQFIDSKTCKPVPSLYVDFWHVSFLFFFPLN
jgi:protocatechuate 3,4-dioxygenase beta subunit